LKGKLKKWEESRAEARIEQEETECVVSPTGFTVMYAATPLVYYAAYIVHYKVSRKNLI
jgi:hypothetical protein